MFHPLLSQEAMLNTVTRMKTQVIEDEIRSPNAVSLWLLLTISCPCAALYKHRPDTAIHRQKTLKGLAHSVFVFLVYDYGLTSRDVNLVSLFRWTDALAPGP